METTTANGKTPTGSRGVVRAPSPRVSQSPRSRPPLHPKTITPRSSQMRGPSPRSVKSSPPVPVSQPQPNSPSKSRRDRDSPVSGLATSPSKRTSDKLSPSEVCASKEGSEGGPSLCMLLLRVVVLMILLLGCVLAAGVLRTSSISWIVSDGHANIINCPKSAVLSEASSRLDAPYCMAKFVFHSYDEGYASSLKAFMDYNDYILSHKMHESLICRSPVQYKQGTCNGKCFVRCVSTMPCAETVIVSSKTDSKPCYHSSDAIEWRSGWSSSTPSDSECVSYVNFGSKTVSQVTGAGIVLEPFCDHEVAVTPTIVVGIWGLLLTGCVLVILFFVTQLMMYYSGVDKALQNKQTAPLMAQSVARAAREMRLIVESKWSQLYACDTPSKRGHTTPSPRNDVVQETDCSTPSGLTHNGPRFETGSLMDLSPRTRGLLRSSSKNGASSAKKSDSKSRGDPRARFASSSWRYRIRLMLGLRVKKQSLAKTRRAQMAVLVVFGYFCLLLALMLATLSVIPETYANGVSRSVWTVVRAHEEFLQNGLGLVDLVPLVDVLLEVVLLLLSVIVVNWGPQVPTTKAMQLHRREKLKTSFVSSVHEYEDLSPLPEGICIFITCHKSATDPTRCERLTRSIRRALTMVPPEALFILDNADSLCPVDDTWKVVKDVHPDINYVFLPEANRNLSIYWANKVWIPYMHKHKMCSLYRHAIICDDDTTLPSDIYIDQDFLKGHPDAKVMHFTTSATHDGTESSKNGFLCKSQDLELKMEAAHLMCQGRLSSALHTQKGISMWERQTLDSIMYEHGVAHYGDNVYSGLLLLRLRDKSTIESNSNAQVPVNVPPTFYELVVERTASGASIRFFWSYLRELLWLPSFCNLKSLILKLHILFGPVLSNIVDIMRPMVILSLIFRDPLALCLLVCVFAVLVYVQEILLLLLLRHRPDVRKHWCTALVFLPVYRVVTGLLRLSALMNYMVGPGGSHESNKLRISVRADDIRDIPPCPPCPIVDWFSVWDPEAYSGHGSVGELSPMSDRKGRRGQALSGVSDISED